MKIAIGCDHGAFALKNKVAAHLEKKGYEVKDFGTWEAVLAIIVAVFSSVAMSGVPGGGGTGELVLCAIFFPAQMAIAYPIAIALGNLVAPPATMVNAAGDYVVSYIVARFVDGKDWLQKRL